MENIMSEVIGQKHIEQFELFYILEKEILNENSRRCVQCNEIKDITCFPYREASHKARRKECRECNKESAALLRKLKRENPFPNAKEYKCPCCLRTEKEIRKNGGWPDRTIWVLDHNHTTKEFRGWICDNCNVAIGRFADSVSSLKKAINYLKDGNEKLKHGSR